MKPFTVKGFMKYTNKSLEFILRIIFGNTEKPLLYLHQFFLVTYQERLRVMAQ